MVRQITLLLSFIICGAASASTPLSDRAIELKYMNAITSSEKLYEHHEAAMKRRNAESAELNKLLRHIVQCEEKEESLQAKVLQRLNADLNGIKILDNHLAKYNVEENGTTWQLKTHKMQLGLAAAIKLCQTDFDNIVSGKLPVGYSFDVPVANIFPNKTHIFSTIRGRALKHLLIATVMVLKRKNDLECLTDILGHEYWKSPFIHPTPMAQGVDLSGIKGAFISKDSLNVLHNGYAFGGQRTEDSKYCDPIMGPQDCSSLISHFYGLPEATSTVDQYLAAQIGLKRFPFANNKQAHIDWATETYPKFSGSKIVTSIMAKMDPVLIRDPSQIKPGMISVERRFKGHEQNPSILQTGRGGHTSVVLFTVGQGPDARVFTLGANRDIEGQSMDFTFGIQSRPIFGDPLKDENAPVVSFFDPNKK